MANVTLMNAIAEVAREDMSPGVRETLPSVDQFFQEMWFSWEGVERSMGRAGYNSAGTQLSTGWIRRWIIKGSGGGFFKFTNPNPLLATPSGQNVQVWASAGSYPGVTDYVTGKWANPYVGLCEGRGTLVMPQQLLQANELDAVMTDVVASNIKDAAENMTLAEAVSWFSRNPTWCEVGRTGAYHPAGATSQHPAVHNTNFQSTTTVTTALLISKFDYEDQVSRFRPGMSVDIWQVWCDYATPSTTVKVVALNGPGFIVDQVDYLNGKVGFVTKDNAAKDVSPVASGLSTTDLTVYIVTLQGSAVLNDVTDITSATAVVIVNSSYDFQTDVTAYTGADYVNQDLVDTFLKSASYSVGVTGYGPDGLVNFLLVSTSQSYYGISAGRLPHLMSIYYNPLNDYYTEIYNNNVLGQFITQYGRSNLPSAAITTNGVLNGYFHNLLLTGKMGSAYTSAAAVVSFNQMQGGQRTGPQSWSLPVLPYRGAEVKVYDTPFARKGSMMMLQTNNKNLKRLMPPPIPGSGREAQFQDVNFIAPLGGLKGIFMHSRNTTGQVTDYLEAPFVMHYQHFLEKPQGVWVRTITEMQGLP